MLSSYRSLLCRPGARELTVISALSWLAFSGYGLALILAAHHATGSYATAGAAVAVESAGAGVLAPIRGRLVDRYGAPALRAIATGHAFAGGLLTLALVDRFTAGVFVAAALVGLSAPPLIAVARTRWTLVAGEDLARTGHALNAALSDAAQIATPAAVAGVALAISPVVALPMLMATAAAAGLVLAARLPRPNEPDLPARPRCARPFLASLLGVLHQSAGLRALAACDLATAGWLAGLEIAVIALAGHRGRPELGVLILAASALGSITMSLLAGAARIGGRPATRYQAGAVLAAVLLPLTLLTTQLAALTAILLCVGAAFGLLNVAFYELIDDVSPPERTTEAFTWLTAASAIGAAIGAVASGGLASTSTAAPSLFITGMATCAAAVALTARGTLRAKHIGPKTPR